MIPSEFIDRVEANDLAAVYQALEAGHDVNEPDRGWTALMCAAQAGLRQMTDGLIGAGADVCASNDAGFTALHMVVQSASRNPERGHYAELRKIAARLVLAGADVNARTTEKQQSPLRNACRAGLPDLVEVLLSAPDADLAQQDGDGAGLLMLAALSRSRETLGLLLGAGLDPNARDAHGATPLHAAAEVGDVVLVEQLLGAGANPLAVTLVLVEDVPAGSTALDVARIRGRAGVVERLQRL
ncbi:MAG: ankyrin repeat domain-containing protein [Deltaproteobacteria bacterium]|nr:MAG: ankyrin repeat domain-containing protein [Deltaproteobacteria bacterium]